MTSSRPKVLHVINDITYWLAHRERLGAAAKAAGFDVTVAAPDDQKSSQLSELGYKFIPLPLDRFKLGIKDFFLIICLSRLVRFGGFDVVHLMTIKPILFGGLALRFANVSRSLNVIATVAGLGRGFDLEGRAFSILRAMLKLGIGKVAKAVTFENPNDADRYISEHIIQHQQAIVLKGAGIDLTEYQPNPSRSVFPIRILFASRLLRSKGIIAFVEAARLLKPIYCEAVEFQVAGMTAIHEPDGLTKAEITTLKNDPCITWLGAIPSDQMPELVANAHIFVLPTSYPEGLPRCLLEAGACGAAVIAGNVPGTRFLIDDEINGILLSSCASISVSEAMKRMIDDSRLRQKMSKKLRNKICENGYSIEAINSEFVRLYAA